MELKPYKPVICVDPGTTHSGVVVFDGERISYAKKDIQNEELLLMLVLEPEAEEMAIEMIASYGMPVGESTFETVLWIGRFIQAFGGQRSTKVYRKDVKRFLCGSLKAKDSNIRQRILDIFPPTGGGATPQVGTKGKPGPLYGITSHALSALAVGLTHIYGREQ